MGSQPVVAKTDYKPERTIKIDHGDVVPGDKVIYVRPQAIVQFVNLDPESYTVVFLLFGEDPDDPYAKHADVDLFLTGYGTSTMVADLGIFIGECNYRVIATPLGSVGRGFTEEIALKMSVGCEKTSEEHRSTTMPRQVMRSASRGGPGGTIHIGG